MNPLKLSVVGLALTFFLTSASAYSGGVTTYAKPTPTTVERLAKSTAIAGPERDATYQRTMRTAQTAAAASKALRGVIKTVAVIGTLVTLAEFAKDLTGIWRKDINGENVLAVPNSNICTTAPCYEFNATRDVSASGWRSSRESACTYAATVLTQSYGSLWTFVGMVGTQCGMSYSDGYGYGYEGTRSRSIEPSAPGEKILSAQELEDAIAQSTRLPQVLVELDQKGTPVPFPDPEVEDMPQPLVLSPTTTIKPDGTKVVEQTTLTPERDPDGKTINWKRNLKTIETSPPDASGNTTTKTTNTDSNSGPSKTDKAPEAPATDSALPDQPKLYTKKYPDGMTGVWRDQRAAMANSPLFTLPRMLMPSSIGSSGACPAMPVNFTFGQWANFGVKDVAPPCYVWDWGRVICIVGACLLARRLIFGG